MELYLVLINVKRLAELIFPLTALIKQISADIKVYIVPISPHELGQPENLLAVIEEIKSLIAEPTPTPTNIRLYLLDIGPETPEEASQLIDFFHNNRSQIIAWIGRGWTANDLALINDDERLIPITSEKEVMRGLEKFGLYIPTYLKQSDQALLSRKPSLVDKEPLALRYIGALAVLRSIDRNNGEDNTLTLLISAALEMINGKTNEYVENLVSLIPDMERLSADALSRFTDNLCIFREAKNMNRPVGYVNLRDVPSHTNIIHIIKEAQYRFPYLVVIRYRIDGEEYTEYSSKKFNVIKETKPFLNSALDRTTLMQLLNIIVITL